MIWPVTANFSGLLTSNLPSMAIVDVSGQFDAFAYGGNVDWIRGPTTTQWVEYAETNNEQELAVPERGSPFCKRSNYRRKAMTMPKISVPSSLINCILLRRPKRL